MFFDSVFKIETKILTIFAKFCAMPAGFLTGTPPVGLQQPAQLPPSSGLSVAQGGYEIYLPVIIWLVDTDYTGPSEYDDIESTLMKLYPVKAVLITQHENFNFDSSLVDSNGWNTLALDWRGGEFYIDPADLLLGSIQFEITLVDSFASTVSKTWENPHP
jgi:hypothetical protein